MPPIPIPKSAGSSLPQLLYASLAIPIRRALRLLPSSTSQSLSRRRWTHTFDAIASVAHTTRSPDHSNALHRRQQSIVVVPALYNTNGAKPSTVIAAVLGSVGGLLLVLWLAYTCYNFAQPNRFVEEEVVVRRNSRHTSHHSPRSVSRARSVRSEVVETTRVRSSTPPPRRESRRETIIVEETRRPERVERDEDIVEVFEEHSPAPPRRSRSGRVSGYRNVDPGEFGGGSRPLRPVR